MNDVQGSERFARAIQMFDDWNARDPNQVQVDGEPHPKELHHARLMSAWIERLHPNAGEAVHLAARCQHLRRWEIPRNSYPEGRAGYLKWRKTLQSFHAGKSAEVLREVGYDDALIQRVQEINLKRGLGKDPEVQAVEDALCMVFLESQFEDYLSKWDEAKTKRILQKTWSKMSPVAREAALAMPMSTQARAIVERALNEDASP